MSNWGIAPTAPEKEKIKAEYADYLNGLNSCGEISYGVYSEAFDVGMELLDKMYELGREEAKTNAESNIKTGKWIDKEYWAKIIAVPFMNITVLYVVEE